MFPKTRRKKFLKTPFRYFLPSPFIIANFSLSHFVVWTFFSQPKIRDTRLFFIKIVKKGPFAPSLYGLLSTREDVSIQFLSRNEALKLLISASGQGQKRLRLFCQKKNLEKNKLRFICERGKRVTRAKITYLYTGQVRKMCRHRFPDSCFAISDRRERTEEKRARFSKIVAASKRPIRGHF